MPDREKAINSLTDIEQIMIARQEICPREELQYWIELQEGVADALSLLKEQEAVKPITEHKLFICPVCKNALFREQKFCHECGKRIEWEGR